MIAYELAKQLKDVGFKQDTEFYYRLGYHTEEKFENGVSTGKFGVFGDTFRIEYYPKPRYTTADVKWNQSDINRLEQTEVAVPSLSELIEACGDRFHGLIRWTGTPTVWQAQSMFSIHKEGEGSTPEEAVAKLWLKLHEKSKV